MFEKNMLMQKLYFVVFKKIKEEVNSLIKGNLETQFAEKNMHVFGSSTLFIFASKDPFKNDDVEQKMFMEDLALLIVKNHLPL